MTIQQRYHDMILTLKLVMYKLDQLSLEQRILALDDALKDLNIISREINRQTEEQKVDKGIVFDQVKIDRKEFYALFYKTVKAFDDLKELKEQNDERKTS